MGIFKPILILSAVFSVQTGAVTLNAFPEPPSELLPIDPSAPNIPCDQVQDALVKFRDMNRKHEDAMAAFLYQVIDLINGWYSTLFNLEGKNELIDSGTFDPIRDGGEKMSMVVDYSYSNAALLSSELERIIVSMQECNLVKK